MVKLRGEDVRAVPLPVASLHTQTAVVLQVNAARRKTDELSSAIGRQLDLLRERRHALVTAAVTGQLEIPGAAT